jgi:predicted phage baseplate assembly protein
VDGLHLNAVWATHRQAVQGEVLGRSDGSPRLTLQTMQKPVLGEPGVHLEVQEWHGTGREWESLVAALPAGTFRLEPDGRERVVGVWVTWQERDHLHSSGPDDRHFTVDRSAGLVGFGDGLAGMVPPPGAAIVVSYTHGGGPRGNQPAGGLSQLQSSVPYVDRVTNPLASSGGAGIETVEQVRKRGPQRVRHRGRALTAADYEWLAHDASAAVALARCLRTGPRGLAGGGTRSDRARQRRATATAERRTAPAGAAPSRLPGARGRRRTDPGARARVPADLGQRERRRVRPGRRRGR